MAGTQHLGSTPAHFVPALRALLGPSGFTDDADRLAPMLTDWRGRYTGRAIGCAMPANREAVAAIVALCHQHGVPIVPQGGNSSMSGGATPDATGQALLVSLRRLDDIAIDTDAALARCGAGVILQGLHDAADAGGLRFPLTLGGKGSATVGGLIATNAGGTQVLRHGTMRAQIAGLETVLPDGRILDLMTPLKKDNRGFDMKQLFIGAEGTLGVVTAALLRLRPAIRQRVTAWIGVSDIHAARALLTRCEAVAGSFVEGFEVLPDTALASVLDYLPGARSPLGHPHPWNVLVEVAAERNDVGDLEQTVVRLLAAATTAGEVADAVIAANDRQAERMWALRDAVSPAERARGPAVQHDIAVPVADMPRFISSMSAEVETAFPGVRALAFGHLGDGNVHFHVRAPSGDAADWPSLATTISRFVHDAVVAAGGTISAEHGIGQMKRDELARLGDPVALDVLRAVKDALDPQGLMNPGKLVPLAPVGGFA